VVGYQFYEKGVEEENATAAASRADEQRAAAEKMTDYMVKDLKGKLQPIGKLALLDEVGKRVDAYYGELGEQTADSGVMGQRARALQLRADVARNSGDSNGAVALYQQALPLAFASTDVELIGSLMLSLGDVLLEQGAMDSADEWFRRAGAVPVDQIAASVHLRRGMVASNRGDNDRALAEWRAAAAGLEALHARNQDDHDVAYNVAVAHGMIGDTLWQANDGAGARAEFQRSQAAAEELIAAEPDNPQWLRARSLATDRLAEMARYEGRLDDAERAFRESLAVAEQLVAHDPANTHWQDDLAISLRNLAGVDYEQEQYDAAIANLQRAIPIEEKVVAADPDDLENRKTLSSLYYQLSGTLEWAKRNDEAIAAERHAVELRREELRRGPDDAWTTFHLADSINHLGWLLTAADPAAALVLLREAHALASRIVAADDQITEWRRVLATTELGIGRALARQGRPGQAREHAARALPMLERLDGEKALTSWQVHWIEQARELLP
jgi:tetratricopeptide (TPR) repeat protein